MFKVINTDTLITVRWFESFEAASYWLARLGISGYESRRYQIIPPAQLQDAYASKE